jgi:hypothetical protein
MQLINGWEKEKCIIESQTKGEEQDIKSHQVSFLAFFTFWTQIRLFSASSFLLIHSRSYSLTIPSLWETKEQEMDRHLFQ